MMPLARMEAANSSKRSIWNTTLGWTGLGWTESIGKRDGASETSAGAAAAAVASPDDAGDTGRGRPGSSAERPLPSALRCFSIALLILEDLLGEFDVAFGASRAWIVHQDWFTKAGGFSETDTARDHCRKYFIIKEFS